MNQPEILIKFLAKKGQVVSLKTIRDVKLRKEFSDRQIKKLVDGLICRAGINYDNMKAVKEKREDGRLPEENQGLPWGEWEIFPHTILHKGNRYLRFSTFKSSQIPTVKYIENGKELSKEEVQIVALASEFQDKKELDVFTMKEESILELK